MYYDNRVLIEFDGYLTPIELEIVKSTEGILAVKNVRDRLTIKVREEYLEKVSRQSGIKINSWAVAWNVQEDEGFILLKLNPY